MAEKDSFRKTASTIYTEQYTVWKNDTREWLVTNSGTELLLENQDDPKVSFHWFSVVYDPIWGVKPSIMALYC